MIQEAIDFRDESEELFQLLRSQDDSVFQVQTLFKEWTVSDVLIHLHTWNWAANASLNEDPEFDQMVEEALPAALKGALRSFENERYAHLKEYDLLDAWHTYGQEVAENFARADPRQRLKWAGPGMSARSSITARLMETWGHGQAIYDVLGVPRKNTDRIKSIAVLGINTFGWSFKVNGLEVPAHVPHIRLTAPSGTIWEWHEAGNENSIVGSAEAFCQVVTQTRNVGDTSLRVSGKTAERWMQVAQCFAGPPEQPPVTGVRHMAG